jgi:hypothetical protein
MADTAAVADIVASPPPPMMRRERERAALYTCGDVDGRQKCMESLLRK